MAKGKSDAISLSSRQEGNRLYERKEHFEALLQYNKALCFAENSQAESLAYSNRSIVYFDIGNYHKCMDNIKLARENQSNEAALFKLAERERKCLSQILPLEDHEIKFELSHAKHVKNPNIISALCITINSKYGRGIYTRENLAAGDVIAIDDIFAKFFIDKSVYRRCCFCLSTNKLSLIPCIFTNYIMFCSIECRATLYNLFDNEVSTLLQLQSFSADSLQTNILSVLTKNLTESFFTQSPRTIFDFDFSDPNDPSREMNRLKCFYGLRRQNGFNHNVPYDFNESSTLEKAEIACYTQCAVKNHQMMLSYYEFPSMNFRCEGTAVSLFGSLLNHSCDPNVDKVLVNNKFVFYTTRPIKAHEQLFICYGLPFYYAPKEERRQMLSRYDFECDCFACLNNYNQLEESLIKRYPKTKNIDEAIKVIKQNWQIINHNKASFSETSALKHVNYQLLSGVAYAVSWPWIHVNKDEKMKNARWKR